MMGGIWSAESPLTVISQELTNPAPNAIKDPNSPITLSAIVILVRYPTTACRPLKIGHQGLNAVWMESPGKSVGVGITSQE